MASTTDPLTESERTRVRRHSDRASFDRVSAYAVIDESYIAHVGFVVDGEPRVLPMTYARVGDVLYLHGAVGNAMLRAGTDAEVCVTFTLLDGLVLARSAFHHSMNYRSVVLIGTATKVLDADEKRVGFNALIEHVLPGRSAVARPSSDAEVRATMVLALPIREGSVKIRTGGPIDEADDMDLPVWAGVVPLHVVAGSPIQDSAQQGNRCGSAPTEAELERGA